MRSLRQLWDGRQDPIGLLAGILVLVAIGGVAGVILVVVLVDGVFKQVWGRVGELSAELVVLGVVGGMVTLVIKVIGQDREDRQKRVEQQRADAEAKRSYQARRLSQLIEQAEESYRQVKQERRILRSQRIDSELSTADYAASMVRLSGVQLNFESLRDAARQIDQVIPEAATACASLKICETYLGELLKPFERGALEPDGRVDVNERGLEKFLVSATEGNFRVFSSAYHNATWALRASVARIQATPGLPAAPSTEDLQEAD